MNWLRLKGPSGFSYYSTAEEVTKGIDGAGLTAIVTGASGGIGVETTRVLALRGVHVIMAVRNAEAGESTRTAIINQIPSAKLNVMNLDLSSMASVRKFASDFISKGYPLNILINNAGVLGVPFTLSNDNIELHFATNHIGHFLLVNLLLDTMKKTAVKSGVEGRIVNVASTAHWLTYYAGIRLAQINDPKGYNKYMAYGQSKLANILHANELSRRLKDEGANLTANSLHPGVFPTGLYKHTKNGVIPTIISSISHYFMKDIPQGAATTCYVALHPRVKGRSGEYFENSNPTTGSFKSRNKILGQKLWSLSMKLTGTH